MSDTIDFSVLSKIGNASTADTIINTFKAMDVVEGVLADYPEDVSLNVFRHCAPILFDMPPKLIALRATEIADAFSANEPIPKITNADRIWALSRVSQKAPLVRRAQALLEELYSAAFEPITENPVTFAYPEERDEVLLDVDRQLMKLCHKDRT